MIKNLRAEAETSIIRSASTALQPVPEYVPEPQQKLLQLIVDWQLHSQQKLAELRLAVIEDFAEKKRHGQ